MSDTRKDRKQWKRKERGRTGQGDPPKIKSHREKVIQKISRSKRIVSDGRYEHVVFDSRYEYVPQEQFTALVVNGEERVEIPFLVIDVVDGHYAIREVKRDFDLQAESKKLADHVIRCKILHAPCRLEVLREGNFRCCTSVIDCRFRKWRDDAGLPECTLIY